MNSYLYHYGILNQKWGRRNGPPYPLDKEDHSAAEKKTLNKSLTGNRHESMYDRNEKKANKINKKYNQVISGNKTTLLGKVDDKSRFYDISDNNKKVGKIIVDDEGDHDHIDWLGIKEKERGKGYGQDALDSVIQDCIKRGKKYVTLDAAGLDPSAIHIYEKKGFKAVEKIDNDIWNGLVLMRKDLKG